MNRQHNAGPHPSQPGAARLGARDSSRFNERMKQRPQDIRGASANGASKRTEIRILTQQKQSEQSEKHYNLGFLTFKF
jgi:hypothetical protein